MERVTVPRAPPSSPNLANDNDEQVGRIIASGSGGALLGGALFSLPGAVIGGLLGIVAAAIRNDELEKQKPTRRLG
jgi:hypothetical protein